MNHEEVKSLYGEIKINSNGQMSWPLVHNCAELIDIPPEIASGWINSGSNRPTRRIFCNKDISPMILAALDSIQEEGLLSELKTFDGCWNPRYIRGQSEFSAHSWALAIDINAATNPLGGRSTMSDKFVECWTKCGFIWGGHFKRSDPMHFTLCF